jgi:hypothetical protein
MVDIGFDPAYTSAVPWRIPAGGISGIGALIDTGAAESCIDSLLAAQLNLPIVDRRPVSGCHGTQDVNMHLALVHVRSLNRTIIGIFAGFHLQAGGQPHRALIGRTFLKHYKMIYNGLTGEVVLESA